MLQRSNYKITLGLFSLENTVYTLIVLMKAPITAFTKEQQRLKLNTNKSNIIILIKCLSGCNEIFEATTIQFQVSNVKRRAVC